MDSGSPKLTNLTTIKSWEGSKSKSLDFHADKAPWVMNCGYDITSNLSSNFMIRIERNIALGLGELEFINIHPTGDHTALVNNTGDYTITVESSGCNWWVRIGVE